MKGGCDLHVFMHGCTQSESEHFMKKLGLFQYAASNNVVVLTPRTTGTEFTNIATGGLYGACWRVPGERPIDEDIQSQAIYEMIKHL